MDKIDSLVRIDFNVLFEAFNKAFSDYEMQLNKEELQCTSISNFLISKCIELKVKQYEMIKQL